MKYSIILATPIAISLIANTFGTESGAQKDLLEADRAAAEAAASGDISRILSIWADDAVMFYPGRKMVVGKQAIRELVTANRQTPGFSIKWSPVGAAVGSAGDLGYTYGSFEVMQEGLTQKQAGDYVCIWRKKNDLWKCVFEMARPTLSKPARGLTTEE